MADGLVAVLARGRLARILGMAALLVVSAAIPLVGPQLMRVFIDEAAAGRPVTLLVAVAGGYVAVSFVQQTLRVLVTSASTHLTWAATNELREKVARHILGLDLSFHERHSPGELIERADGDVTALTSFASSFLVQFVGSAVTLLGVLVVVFVEDWRVGLGLAGFVVVAGVTIGRVRHSAVPMAVERRAASAALFGELEERLGGAEELRANAGGAFAIRRFQRALERLIRVSRRASLASRTNWVVTLTVFAAGGVASLLAGTLLFQAGSISLGTVYLLFRYTDLLRGPLEAISDQLPKAQEALAGVSRVRQVLAERSAVPDDGRATLPPGPLSVELDGVRFAYTPDTDVLGGLSLTVEPGTVLGVVGRTGSGKTTVTRLLLRLLDPTDGAVRIAGTDVRHVRLADLRKRVALVTQDVQLFAASLRDNLTLFGAHRADDDEMVAVLRDLGLGDWYRALPDGLDTVLGPGGAGASAGEAQLVAFARVFLRDPGLVVLDEATSRMDPVSEARIERAVTMLLVGRTAIVIAHRLGTLDRADRILVLERGRIAEHGPRQALADDAGSLFAGLLAAAAGGVR
ncbi:ABC transporter ATP-binding protein [Pseudonocardia humida]|uniref:ABC transporter ATP-binding protein n=1 Tax=Pseudonocardia humida TaxID=2800819 RepID=A0ABT1ACS8_9PSEU|nr:ABC transporter ATP-binding protein [Pseudonocardia humida]MCO1660808.1 ABC transporter ATP-binding protein [Pseudonocardia humida]